MRRWGGGEGAGAAAAAWGASGGGTGGQCDDGGERAGKERADRLGMGSALTVGWERVRAVH